MFCLPNSTLFCIALNTLYKQCLLLSGQALYVNLTTRISDLLIIYNMYSNKATNTINRVTSFKLIGVYIDSTMSWTIHVDNMVKKSHSQVILSKAA